MQRTSTYRQRHRRRAAVLAGATLCFSLSGSNLAAHADDGLLGGVTEVVGETTSQVPSVVETVESNVPEPVEQVVAPVVPPADAPSDVGRAVEEVVTAGEQAAEPAGSTPEPVAPRAEPVVQPAPGATAAQTPTDGAPGTSDVDDVSDPDGPSGGADHADGGDRGRHGHRAFQAVVRIQPDLAPRRVNRPAPLLHDDEDVEEDAGRSLWELTYDLMRLSAGQHVPGAVDAGLAGASPTIPRTPSAAATALLLLGLALACVSLVLARRRLG